ncbi:hypothetical protein [Oxalicibacterium solurbis]|uniref:Uncharacterized protein n=1 Tax=Oxalicibacterium solurbis TaxID=69280 RepID=A0A8J3AY25_9BURK|nr:hypothetical protein [Oxalicibacterium solurbis]GGI54251.1 hypothetical protein GCM10011430_14250 [Oxalicibacterium solurbis]
MRRNLALAAYGWLAATGLLHFVIDVAAQFLRGARPPGIETMLYYGLNTAFACGQVTFGLLGLWLAWRMPQAALQWPVVALTLLAAAAWLLIAWIFIGYQEPKFNAAVFVLLSLAVAATAGMKGAA